MRPDILTFPRGRYFNFVTPAESEFGIAEIAHALSHICRFGGHCREFYSVAQHSVHVSYLVPEEDRLAALLHDAAEAFIGDVVAPLKQLLPEYKIIERRIERVILSRFGLPQTLPASVKQADLIMLATEQRDLMPAHDDNRTLIDGIQPMTDRVVPMPPSVARRAFLARFDQLAAARVTA